jgi:hypothetical protein
MPIWDFASSLAGSNANAIAYESKDSRETNGHHTHPSESASDSFVDGKRKELSSNTVSVVCVHFRWWRQLSAGVQI